MNTYITAPTIKALREQKKLTQAQLADQLSVSHKTISKWETGKGLPDISLLEPLAKALGVSLPELFSGQPTTNANRSANLLRSKLYVCPVCAYASCGTHRGRTLSLRPAFHDQGTLYFLSGLLYG